ncbi:MAG: hypothetical protein EA403_12880 [Spirochaetaceae bacterium]|nr:MAG: hypothetical protein EA403_12880 [Spirochaetaceae bacterium]
MSRHGRTALIVLLSIYLLAAVGSVAYTLAIFPRPQILPAFQVSWILWASVATLISILPTAHLTALLLLYSLFITRTPASRGEDLLPALRGPLVLCTILAMLFALLVGLVEPYALARRDGAEHQSRFASAVLEQGQQHFARGEYDRAIADFARYLRLVESDEEITARMILARSRVGASEATGAAASQVSSAEDTTAAFDSDGTGTGAFATAARREGPDAVTLSVRAREALERGDYFSAHYYARLALALVSDLPESAQLPEARQTLTNATDRMKVFGQTVEEQDARELFERKRRAHEGISSGNALDLIEAYHQLSDLLREHPSDPDVIRYYPVARAAVQEVSFFLSELRDSEHFPSRSSLTFRNGREAATREFVHIDRLTLGAGGVYAEGIEVLHFGADGTVRFHARAPYGKVIERVGEEFVSWIVMRAVDRDARLVYEPEFLEGSAEHAHILPLRIPVDRLELVAVQGASPADHRLPELLQQARLLPDFGYPVEPVLVEIAMRLLRPFSLLVFSLFAVAFGLRSHYLGRPKLLVVAAGIVLPVVIHYTIPFYLFAYRVLLGYVVLTAGLAVMIAVLVVTQALLLVWALFAMAAQMASA